MFGFHAKSVLRDKPGARAMRHHARSFLQGCPNQPDEQRVRPVGTALELGMELHPHNEAFFRQLHGLHDVAVRGLAAEAEAMLFQQFPIVVVEIVQLAMALADLRRTVPSAIRQG